MKRNAVTTLSMMSAFSGALIAVSPGHVFAQQAMTPPRPVYAVNPSTQTPERLVTAAKLNEIKKQVSNWGRWSDQRGTLNLITPEKMKQAAGLIREGLVVSLEATPFGKTGMETGAFGENLHRMSRINPDGTIGGAIDWLGFGIHDGLNSHMDALCHYAAEIDGKKVGINGLPQNLTAAGCGNLGTDKMGPGVVTRGVLVDMPLMKGVKWLPQSTPIYVEDLEQWEKYAGVKIGPGDALLIRSGRWAERAAEGPFPYGQTAAGLHASVLPWLKARDVAFLVSDAVNDVQPSGVQGTNRPIHDVTMPYMGLPIVDNGYLEDVADTAARLHRWEFFFSYPIMPIPGGTAAPFTAVATF